MECRQRPCHRFQASPSGDAVALGVVAAVDVSSLPIAPARGTEDFNLISQQVDNNRLPARALIESLGFDADDVQAELRRELTSMFNPAMRDMISGTLSNLSDPISQTKAIVDKVADSLGMPELKKQDIPVEDNDKKK